MPLTRRTGSPCWNYSFYFGGRRHRGSTGCTSKAAAQAFEARLLAEMALTGAAPTRAERSPLLRDFLPRFTAMVAAHTHLDADTKRYYTRGVSLLAATPLKDIALDRITTSIVAAVPFPLSAATGNNAIRTLSRALGYAVELGMLLAAPRLKQYAEQGRDAVYTPEQEAALLAVAPQPLHDVFVVLMDTGMRPEEVCRLRWEDVLWTEGELLVRGSLPGAAGAAAGTPAGLVATPVRDGKTRAARRAIRMSSRVRAMLMDRARQQSTHKRQKDSPWVFPSRVGGGARHIDNVNKAFRTAREAAGLPAHLVLYTARHTFGTEFMAATRDLKLTMTTMGHVDVKTSMRYQHPETSGVADIIDARNAQRKSATAPRQDGHTFGHNAQVVQ